MTGIFGVFRQDHCPIDPDAMARMDAAMANWGADGGGIQQSGHVALASRLRWITAEDRSEIQPLVAGPCVLVAHARLDNRVELCRQLALDPDVPESAVILAAYQRHGQECVQHLRGDWVFALWDATAQSLLVARDATGNTGLYWYTGGGVFAFSTGVRGLLALPGVPRRPDPLTVAGLLTAFNDPSRPDATAYEGIRRLPPGHLLHVDSAGAKARCWWAPENLPSLQIASADECDEAFLALYRDAVVQRLRVADGTVAATLSAGLDSGSVVSLAAPKLLEAGQRLKAYVHVPLYAPNGAAARRTGDEYELALQTARHVGNVDLVALRSEGVSVLQGIDLALQAYAAPAFVASNEYWIADVLRTARADGAKVLLTGQGGNGTVSFNGHGSLWPAVFSGRLMQALSALGQERGGALNAVKMRLIRPIVVSARSRWRRRALQWRGEQRWMSYSAIRPEFAEGVGLYGRMREAGFDPSFTIPFAMNGALRNFRLGLPRGGATWGEWMERSAMHGLDVRDPTRDQRIVEFCWRLPDDIFWGAGRQRALIRRGMQNHLPTSVLECRHKGLQSADLVARLKAIEPELRQAVSDISRHPLACQWLDVERMRNALAKLRDDPSPALMAESASVLARACSVGRFLSTF